MSKYNFLYLLEKIESQSFEVEPFKHIQIEDFFSKEHFEEIIYSNEIAPPKQLTTKS